MIFCYFYKTIIGNISISSCNGFIVAIKFLKEMIECTDNIIIGNDTVFKETPTIINAYRQIEEYFCGKRKKFDIKMKQNGTNFQRRVWKVLEDIPYGKTCSYKDVATAVGNPKAYRAIGMANNRNNLPILVPCHRVVGNNGGLTGYAGGINIKLKLLELENKFLFIN